MDPKVCLYHAPYTPHTLTHKLAHLQTHAHKNKVLTHPYVFNLSKCFSTPPYHLPSSPPSLSHTSPFWMLPLILPSAPPLKRDTDTRSSGVPLSSLCLKSFPLLLMLVSGLKDMDVQHTKSLIRLNLCFIRKQINQTFTHCICIWVFVFYEFSSHCVRKKCTKHGLKSIFLVFLHMAINHIRFCVLNLGMLN